MSTNPTPDNVPKQRGFFDALFHDFVGQRWPKSCEWLRGEWEGMKQGKKLVAVLLIIVMGVEAYLIDTFRVNPLQEPRSQKGTWAQAHKAPITPIKPIHVVKVLTTTNAEPVTVDSRLYRVASVHGSFKINANGSIALNTGNVFVGTAIMQAHEIQPGLFVIYQAPADSVLDLADLWVRGKPGDGVVIEVER